jgi:hypothetical protein
VAKLRNKPEKVSLSELLVLYRGVLRLRSIETLLKDCSLNSDTVSSMQFLIKELQENLSSCEKFLALVEDVVDLQRVKDTYGGRRRDISSSSFDDATQSPIQSMDVASSNADAYSGEDVLWHDKWVRVRPDFDHQLQHFIAQIESTQSSMIQEHSRIVQAYNSNINVSSTTSNSSSSSSKASVPPSKKRKVAPAGSDAKVIMMENNSVHGPHFRVTKTHATKVLQALKAQQASSKGNLFQSTCTSSAGAGGEGAPKSEGWNVTVLSAQKAGTLFVTAQVSMRCIFYPLFRSSLVI